MNEFEYDVWQKKIIARQASHRKRGSKSKKCSLLSDHLTNKQWKEMNGKMITYNLSKPMLWKDFLELPKKTQKEYLESLIEKYGTTGADLGKMFGVQSPTVTKLCKDPEIDIVFSVGKRMNVKQRTEFEKFLCCEETDVAITERVPEVIAGQDDCQAKLPAQEMGMIMDHFTLSFSGRPDTSMIFNSLKYMLPENMNVRIDITCTLE